MTDQEVAKHIGRRVRVELDHGATLVGQLMVSAAYGVPSPYCVVTWPKGTPGALDAHAQGILAEKVVRIDEIPEDERGVDIEYPAHESEGQALTEASQTDDRDDPAKA